MSRGRKGNSFELLTDREVEAEYKIARATQKKWRRMKYHDLPGYNGFPFLKIGRIVRYRRTEIEAWLTAQSSAGESRPVNKVAAGLGPGQLELFERR